MGETQSIIFGVILFSLVIYFNYRMIKRLFHFFKSHLKEIIIFIEKHDLELIEVKKPKTEDWRNNPFKNKSSQLFEIVLPFSLLSHEIITAKNSNGVYFKYWLQTTSLFFGKNKLEFQEDESKNIDFDIKKEVEKNIKIVHDKCPGCFEKIELTDSECNHCGLVFE
ncbi:hypothetical protein [Aquimarina sp. 2304DJ70-9]|uniref:hypothetical protein n=1 Tax=Aquimarina penaris TaxID=3231044 RepID=UPI0034630671